MQSMFSVPMYRYTVTGWPAKKAQLLSALPEVNEAHRSPAGDTYTDFFLNNEGTELPAYKDVVQDSLAECLEEFGHNYPGPVEITSMWFERSFKSNYHGSHNHGSLGFSALLYLEFDPLEHRPTRFIAPFNGFYDGGLVTYQPDGINEGTLLIWPATILHDIEPNRSNTQRTIVSFNIRGAPH